AAPRTQCVTLAPRKRGEGGERPQASSRASSTRYGREPDEAHGALVGPQALLWQILSGTGFPNQFFCDSWVVGFGGADHGWKDVGLERRAWTLSQAVCGSVGSQGAATNVSTLRVGADRSWRS